AAVTGHLGQVAVRPQQAADGLAKVDDVDQIALAVDVRPHLGVPPAGTVSEVDAGLDQVLNLDNGHALPSSSWLGKTWFVVPGKRRSPPSRGVKRFIVAGPAGGVKGSLSRIPKEKRRAGRHGAGLATRCAGTGPGLDTMRSSGTGGGG